MKLTVRLFSCCMVVCHFTVNRERSGRSFTLPVTEKPSAYEKSTLHLANMLREAPWKTSWSTLKNTSWKKDPPEIVEWTSCTDHRNCSQLIRLPFGSHGVIRPKLERQWPSPAHDEKKEMEPMFLGSAVECLDAVVLYWSRPHTFWGYGGAASHGG